MKKIIAFIVIALFPASLLAVNYTTDANCKGAWLMTSNGGTENDVSSNGENLTENGGTIATSTHVPTGRTGTSRRFTSSSSQYLLHADGGSTDIYGANQNMSIVFWFKAASINVDQSIVSKYDSTQKQYKAYLYSDNSMNWLMSSDGSGYSEAYPDETYANVTWYHIAVTYDDSYLRVYTNGSITSQTANPLSYTAGIYNGTAPFLIGARKSSGSFARFFNGWIYEVAIFNRCLSASEVSDIYTNGLGYVAPIPSAAKPLVPQILIFDSF